jgi:hypothetical protein
MGRTSTSKLPREGIVARDCRRSCIHELAHAVVARQSTGHVLVQISPQIDGAGEQSPRSVNGLVLFDEINDPLARGAVGWAGYVGEIFEGDPHLDCRRLLEFYQPSLRDLSESDKRMIAGLGKKDRERAIEIAVAAVRAGWPEILKIARALEQDYAAIGSAAATWDGQWRLTDGRTVSVPT